MPAADDERASSAPAAPEPAPAPRRVRDRWTAISVLVAVLSLAGALVFNAIQVGAGADAQRQARLATELSLLTQLQSVLSQAVYSRTPYTKQFRELRTGRRADLGPAAYRITAEEAATLDYLAWLFDNGYVDTGRADQIWGPRMICEYRQALAPGLRDPAHDMPHLIQFIQERGHQLSRLVERC